MRVVSYHPRAEEFSWTFGGVPPVMKVEPGDIVELWTEDAFGGPVSLVTSPRRCLNAPASRPAQALDHGGGQLDGAEPAAGQLRDTGQGRG